MLVRKIASLLTAAALSGGVASTVAIVAPSAAASEPRMAELHEPYHEGIALDGCHPAQQIVIQSDPPLPKRTLYLLNGRLYSSTTVSPAPDEQTISYSMLDPRSGIIQVYRGNDIPETGTAVNLDVTMIYPDSSSEHIYIPVTAIPSHPELYDFTYETVTATGGDTFAASPRSNDLPTGTRIYLSEPSLKRNVDAGWDIDITSDGTITATAPYDADARTYILVNIDYPDGCSESTRLRVNTTPPSEDSVPDDTAPENPAIPSPPQLRGSSLGSS